MEALAMARMNMRPANGIMDLGNDFSEVGI
jgi:hypothetical protein